MSSYATAAAEAAATVPIKLVVGLGNPGQQYVYTRHNEGFRALDVFQKWYAIDWSSTAGGLIAHITLTLDRVKGEEEPRTHQVVLFKPSSFMNDSGLPTASLMAHLGVKPSELLVVHDDIDIPPKELRWKFGGSAGGHNGVKSVEKELGAKDFHRLRVGVGRPATRGRDAILDWVLSTPEGVDPKALEDAAVDAALWVEHIIFKSLGEFR